MKHKIKLRSDGTRKVISTTSGKSLTLQSERDNCCVHKIMEKHKKTGVLSVRRGYENPMYGDYSSPLDYQEAQNTIIKAHEQFDSLPAALREKFGNDPSLFLEFCTNEDNKQDMIDMGLIQDPEEAQNSSQEPPAAEPTPNPAPESQNGSEA